MKFVSALFRRCLALIKLSFIKVIHKKAFKFNIIELVSMSTKFTFNDRGIIYLGKAIGSRRNVEFRANGGKISIGESCFLIIIA